MCMHVCTCMYMYDVCTHVCMMYMYAYMYMYDVGTRMMWVHVCMMYMYAYMYMYVHVCTCTYMYDELA